MVDHQTHKTAVATLDIAQMVKEMRSAVSSGVMEMDKFIAEVRQSAHDVANISSQLSQIIEHIQGISPQIDDVNTAMGQQSTHARAIREDIIKLSVDMQLTTASVQESFNVIDQVRAGMQDLQGAVSHFAGVSTEEQMRKPRVS